jgi:hypothetical protein
MDGTLHYRLPVVVLLLFCAAPSRLDAQQFVCSPIARGDTAPSLARRLTGKASAAYTHAFQIRDPARRMFVPKSHYQRLKTGWQACVASAPLSGTPLAHAPVVALAAVPTPDAPMVAESPPAPAPTPVALAQAAATPFGFPVAPSFWVAVLVMLLFSAAAGLLTQRPIPPAIRRAGDDFVAAFAWPLVDLSPGVPPIRTRLKFVRRTEQLEISIAPGPGRRYPNLADHKKNVEYDVGRVMRILGNGYVLTNPPRAAGKWVVVTISSDRAQAKRSAFEGIQ